MDSTVTATAFDGPLLNLTVRKVTGQKQTVLSGSFRVKKLIRTLLTPPLELELATAIAVYASAVGVNRGGAQNNMKMHRLIMAKGEILGK
jgi:hypothetical protein